MRYYLDTEFDGLEGALISLALVREDGRSFYALLPKPYRPDAWVAENVLPIIHNSPVQPVEVSRDALPWAIAHFLAGDGKPHIVADWPDDIAYFSRAVITGPGTMAPIPHLTFEVQRVDAYPTTLPGAVQHNAWWDAMALRHRLAEDGSQPRPASDGEDGKAAELLPTTEQSPIDMEGRG